jgi:hypothetical protein
LDLEDGFKGVDEGGFDFGEGDRGFELGGHRGNAFVPDATRDDKAKTPKVRIHIERKPVHRNPPREFDAHGGDFTGGLKKPDARMTGDSFAPQAPLSNSPNDHLFQASHIPGNIALVSL